MSDTPISPGAFQRLNPDGSMDEFIAEDVAMVHVEQMSANCWWMGVTMKDGHSIHLAFSAKRADVEALVTIVDPPHAAIKGK